MEDRVMKDFPKLILAVKDHLEDHQSFYLFGVAGTVILYVFFKFSQYIRSLFPVTVNCWFCNTNSKVPLNEQNSWYCKHCEQYNGFSEDGGYNKVIPEQFYEGLNPEYADKSAHTFISTANGLCKHCNINQELKRAQLASFEPLDPNNYDWEIEAFSELLEKNYKLCSHCERVVSNTLESQIKSLNLNGLIASAGHKLASSSVRFLNHSPSPVDLAHLLKRAKHSLWISFFLCGSLLVESHNEASKSVLESLLHPALELISPPSRLSGLNSMNLGLLTIQALSELSKFNTTALIFFSVAQIVQRHKNRIIIDYVTQLGWLLLILLELSPIFMESRINLKYAQALILAMIFTISLWKLVYFKYFHLKTDRKSQFKSNVNPAIKIMNSPPTASNDFESTPQKITADASSPLRNRETTSKYVSKHNIDGDLGIGSLNLGTGEISMNTMDKNVFALNRESFPSKRKPLILPSRLNFNLRHEVGEINLPLSRPSSQSSGYETIPKSGGYDSQNCSLNGDEDYEAPLKSSPPSQLLSYSNLVSPPFLPSPNVSPYELYTYYHFTAKFHASYGPQAAHNVSSCSSCTGAASAIQTNSHRWFLIIFLVFLLLVLQESFILYTILNR